MENVVEVVDGKKERRGGRQGRILKYLYFLGRGSCEARRGETFIHHIFT
jgi:hypothetical protein